MRALLLILIFASSLSLANGSDGAAAHPRCLDFLNAAGRFKKSATADDLAATHAAAFSALTTFRDALAAEAGASDSGQAEHAFVNVPNGQVWHYETNRDVLNPSRVVPPDAVLRRVSRLAGKGLATNVNAPVAAFTTNNVEEIKLILNAAAAPVPPPPPAKSTRRNFLVNVAHFMRVAIPAATLTYGAVDHRAKTREWYIHSSLEGFLADRRGEIEKQVGELALEKTKVPENRFRADFENELAWKKGKAERTTIDDVKREYARYKKTGQLDPGTIFNGQVNKWATLASYEDLFSVSTGVLIGVLDFAALVIAYRNSLPAYRNRNVRPPPPPPAVEISRPEPDPFRDPLDYLLFQVERAEGSKEKTFIPAQYFYVGSNTQQDFHIDVVLRVDRRTSPPSLRLSTFQYREKVLNYWPPGTSPKEQFAESPDAPPVPLTPAAIAREVVALREAIVRRNADLNTYDLNPVANRYGKIAELKITPGELTELTTITAGLKDLTHLETLDAFIERLEKARN